MWLFLEKCTFRTAHCLIQVPLGMMQLSSKSWWDKLVKYESLNELLQQLTWVFSQQRHFCLTCLDQCDEYIDAEGHIEADSESRFNEIVSSHENITLVLIYLLLVSYLYSWLLTKRISIDRSFIALGQWTISRKIYFIDK